MTDKTKAGDVFARALREPTLDAAVTIIKRGLELPNDVVIADSFSSRDHETYRSLLNCYRRAEFIKAWIMDELDAAAERVGMNG